MWCVLFAELAAATEDVRALRGRKDKIGRLAAALRGRDEAERAAGAGYLAGAPRQRVLGVGWASLRELPQPAVGVSLSVVDVGGAFAGAGELSGGGSAAARRAALTSRLGRATASEQA